MATGHDPSGAAEGEGLPGRAGLAWALVALAVQHLTVARIAEGLGVAWNTANDAVLAEGKRLLISDPARFDGVKVIGVDKHVWRHTRRGDKYVTVVIGLTPIRDGTGPARLLDMVEGRSKAAFKAWLADRPQAWREAVEVVARPRAGRTLQPLGGRPRRPTPSRWGWPCHPLVPIRRTRSPPTGDRPPPAMRRSTPWT